MDFDAYERELWAGRAAVYERGFAQLTAHTAGALLDAAGVAAGTKVLDVGTGPGVVAAGVPWPDDIPVPPMRAYSSLDAFAALLAGAGLAGVTARLLGWKHRVDPGEWWEQVYLSGVGSNAVVIGRQQDATVARIKDEFDRLVARYAVDAGQVALPAVAVLGSGQRAAPE